MPPPLSCEGVSFVHMCHLDAWSIIYSNIPGAPPQSLPGAPRSPGEQGLPGARSAPSSPGAPATP
eukprot:9470338-Pyramimonas_sp.AAC.1